MMNCQIEINLVCEILSLTFGKVSFSECNAPYILHSAILKLWTHDKVKFFKWVFYTE